MTVNQTETHGPSEAIRNVGKCYRELAVSSQGRPQSKITKQRGALKYKGQSKEVGTWEVGGLYDFKVRHEMGGKGAQQ